MPPRAATIHRRLLAFALTFPDAWEDHPWDEHTVAKVGKKIFVFMGDASIGVKLPESVDMALQAPGAERMAYGLGKWGWVTIPFGTKDSPEIELYEDWIEESFRAVATKTLVKRLDAQLTDGARPMA